MTTGQMYSVLDAAQTEAAFGKAIDNLLGQQHDLKKMPKDLLQKIRSQVADEYRRSCDQERNKKIFRWVNNLAKISAPEYQKYNRLPDTPPKKDDELYSKTLGNWVSAQVYRAYQYEVRKYDCPKAAAILAFIDTNFTRKVCPVDGPYFKRVNLLPVEPTLEDFFGELDSKGLRTI